jgi:hypothetical protein
VSLRLLAIADHAAILSDVTAFATAITVTNPAGVSVTLAGLASDVGEVVDPETGLGIMGRRVTVQLLPAVLAPLGEVRAVSEGSSKPWTVRFADAHGIERTYKVIEVLPDNDLGSVRCVGEVYKSGVS